MTEHKKPDIAPGYLDADGARRYLDVSKSFFEDHIRPLLAVHDFKAPGSKKPMPKFARADLDAWAQTRRKERTVA
jgi:hypothetical protein